MMEYYHKIIVSIRDISVRFHSREGCMHGIPGFHKVMDLGASGEESMQLVPQRMVISGGLLPTINITTARIVHRATIAIKGYP